MAQQIEKPINQNINKPYRVAVVDDSAVVRGLIRRFLEKSGVATVVAAAADGQSALRVLSKTKVDVVVLDIEMPRMDGLTALPLMLKQDPALQVVMTSTLSLRNAKIAMTALEKGAKDFLPKPEISGELAGAYARQLIEKVVHLGEAGRKMQTQTAGFPQTRSAKTNEMEPPASSEAVDFSLREFPKTAPKVIAIGSSTGGPNALRALFSTLSPEIKQPILVTQHMPSKFTRILAENIGELTGRETVEASDGMGVRARCTYVAPGGLHLTVSGNDTGPVVRLLSTPPENFCRPAVDPMLRSLVKVFGNRVLVVILTGMGADGLKGSEGVVAAGGTVIAQDQATSVVWGMPGAVATAGLCSFVGPIGNLGKTVNRIALGD